MKFPLKHHWIITEGSISIDNSRLSIHSCWIPSAKVRQFILVSKGISQNENDEILFTMDIWREVYFLGCVHGKGACCLFRLLYIVVTFTECCLIRQYSPGRNPPVRCSRYHCRASLWVVWDKNPFQFYSYFRIFCVFTHGFRLQR